MDAARALAGEPERFIHESDRKAFDDALAEYISGQLFNAERPEAHANLAGLYRDQGKFDAARTALEKAIRLDPKFYGAAVALAELLRAQRDEKAAEDVLRKSILQNPKSGDLRHALGLSLVRQRRTNEALDSFSEAARLAPESPRFGYVLAIAQHDSGIRATAMETFEISFDAPSL